MENKRLVKLVVSAMFAALCCVSTMIIRIPTIGTNGYVNIGDTIVLLSAWMIGGVYGAAAAGIGAGLADLLASYVTYVPGTFVIKFLMAIIAYAVYKGMIKAKIKKVVSYIVSAVLAEAVMVVGYLFYEGIFLGYGMAAVASVGSNVIQGVACLVLGIIAVGVLESGKALRKIKSITE